MSTNGGTMSEPKCETDRRQLYLESIEDGFVLLGSDDTDDVKEGWKQRGYNNSVVDQAEELTVFFSKDHRRAESNDEDLAASDVFVEAEMYSDDDDSGPVLKGRGIIQKWIWSNVNTESIRYMKIFETDQQAFASLLFKHGCNRSNDRDHTGLRLRLMDVTFGVENSINDPCKKGHFVTRLEVCASPTESWRSIVENVGAGPGANWPKISHCRQDTTGTSCGVNINGLSAPGFQVGISSGRTFTQNNRKYFGWASASKENASRAVTWVWELTNWADGTEFSVKRSRKWWNVSSDVPKLPYDNLGCVIALNEDDEDIILEAEWTASNANLRGMEEVEWDITVNISTALMESPGLSPLCNTYRYQTCYSGDSDRKCYIKSKVVQDLRED